MNIFAKVCRCRWLAYFRFLFRWWWMRFFGWWVRSKNVRRSIQFQAIVTANLAFAGVSTIKIFAAMGQRAAGVEYVYRVIFFRVKLLKGFWAPIPFRQQGLARRACRALFASIQGCLSHPFVAGLGEGHWSSFIRFRFTLFMITLDILCAFWIHSISMC